MNSGDTWWERQLVSVDSYRVQHEARDIHPSTLAVYRLFGAYIRAAVFEQQASRPHILDVGCGIFPKLSPAVEGITEYCEYLGLDPLPYNEDREYPFVRATLEELADRDEYHDRFDLFVFGTSIDHLDDLEAAAAAVRKLAAADARIVCWNGLHDPEVVASDNGATLFSKITSMTPVLAMLAYFGYGALRLPRLLFRMRKRRRLLASGTPLDHHSRWFTRANTNEILSVFGEVVDVMTLPNTNHSFATIRISS